MAYRYLDQIWLLGDSITQFSFSQNGIGARFADVYARKLDVINRGYSGYNARWDAIVLKQILPTVDQRTQQNLPNIRLLTIWLGTNDSVAPGSPQHVSIPDFHTYMTEIITLIRERSPETRIVLISPGPCQISRTKANFYDNKTPPQAMNRSNEQVKKYVDAVKEIGIQTNLPVIDVWSAIWAAAGSDDDDALEPFFSDGLHLAAPGYKIVWDQLFETIKSKYPELHPDALKMDFIAWDQVDHLNPEKSLQRGEY